MYTQQYKRIKSLYKKTQFVYMLTLSNSRNDLSMFIYTRPNEIL